MFLRAFFILCMSFIYTSCIDIGTETQSNTEQGKSLYLTNNCGTCHGNSGEGGIYPIVLKGNTNVNANNKLYLSAIIKNGRGVMPAGNYTDAQNSAIVEYILTLNP